MDYRATSAQDPDQDPDGLPCDRARRSSAERHNLDAAALTWTCHMR